MSLPDSHIVCWKRWENLPTARARYPPCYPFVFLFWGYPGPQSCDDLPLPLRWEHRGKGGGVYWSLLAAKRLYDYCSLSDWSVQWKNNRGDNPQRSPSGLTDWKLLDCLIIKYVFSLEALEWCAKSPGASFFFFGSHSIILSGCVCI